MANWYIDHVSGVTRAGLTQYNTGTTYAIGDRVVKYTDSVALVYESLQNANLNNNPDSSPTWWSLLANGSNTKPYKIEGDIFATGMTAGDEIRHAKGPARTNISVNLTWTDGSTSVVATGTDVTGEIAAGDWICKSSAVMGATETVYSVASISYSGGNTTIVLSWKYYGSTGAAASQKIGVIDCGTVSSTTVVHATQKDGTAAAPILHTGGWTLATETRDGETYYLQSNATLGGYCFGSNGKTDQTYQYLGALRFGRGFVWSSATSVRCTVEDCVASGGDYGCAVTAGLARIADFAGAGNATYGISSNGVSLSVSNCLLNSNTTNLYMSAGVGASIASCVCVNGTVGMSVGGSCCFVSACTCTSALTYGIRVLAANCTIAGCTCSSNATGINATGADNCVVTNLTAASNSTANLSVTAGTTYATVPMLLYERLNGTDAANGAMYEYGAAVNDEASERTAGQSSIKVTPTSADYGCDVLLARAACADGVGNTLSVYAKDDADHNGVVSMFIRGPMASITDGPTAQTLTTSWAQYTIAIDAGDVPDDGVIELWARVTGTAGNVWFADPGVS